MIRWSSEWRTIGNTSTKSMDTLKKRIALIRKANPEAEFKAVQIKGPRGGLIEYNIEGRKKR